MGTASPSKRETRRARTAISPTSAAWRPGVVIPTARSSSSTMSRTIFAPTSPMFSSWSPSTPNPPVALQRSGPSLPM
ncbi:hypothetical protein EI94DRAFT_1744104 [Lactarius quietus]|nr:hypothetical protein EI94DRAFT_1744104 [Lactarius quietus]